MSLLGLSTYLAFLLSFPVAAIATFVSAGSLDAMHFGPTLAWAGVLTFLTAWLDIASYWRSRRGRFAVTARNGLVRSVATGVGQVGFFSLASLGLLLGALFGAAIAGILSAVDIVRNDRSVLSKPGWRRLARVAKRHRHHPLYGMPQGWIASMSWNLMPLLLMRYAGAAVTGQYWIAYRLLVAPVALFNGVYRQASFPHFARSGIRRSGEIAVRHAFLILAVGLIPVWVLHEYGEVLFSLLMGKKWELAGTIAGWMAIGILADFFKIPIQCHLQSHALQRRLLLWEASVMGTRYIVAVCFAARGDVIGAVAAFSIIGCGGWLLLLLSENFLIRRLQS